MSLLFTELTAEQESAVSGGSHCYDACYDPCKPKKKDKCEPKKEKKEKKKEVEVVKIVKVFVFEPKHDYYSYYH